jgi:hypothetical protein
MFFSSNLIRIPGFFRDAGVTRVLMTGNRFPDCGHRDDEQVVFECCQDTPEKFPGEKGVTGILLRKNCPVTPQPDS